VTGFCDACTNPGGTIRHPPEHEESAPYAAPQPSSARAAPCWPRPGNRDDSTVTWNRRRQRGDVVVVLDVDRKELIRRSRTTGASSVAHQTLIHRKRLRPGGTRNVVIK